MRVREARQGRRVVVKGDAPGSLASVVGRHGAIFSASGRIVRVRLDDGPMRDIDARWLDLETEPPKPAESEELIAYKRRLAETAQRYAREHNLCDITNDFLKEMGVEPPPPGLVRITLEIPEREFDEYRGESDNGFEADVVEHLRHVLRGAYESEREAWAKSIEIVAVKEDT